MALIFMLSVYLYFLSNTLKILFIGVLFDLLGQ